jgi:hypothetical protein
MVRLEQRKSPRLHRAESSKRSKANALNTVDYEALAQFRYRLRLFLVFSDMKAKNAGITSQQYQALLAIKGFSSQSEWHPFAVKNSALRHFDKNGNRTSYH